MFQTSSNFPQTKEIILILNLTWEFILSDNETEITNKLFLDVLWSGGDYDGCEFWDWVSGVYMSIKLVYMITKYMSLIKTGWYKARPRGQTNNHGKSKYRGVSFAFISLAKYTVFDYNLVSVHSHYLRELCIFFCFFLLIF